MTPFDQWLSDRPELEPVPVDPETVSEGAAYEIWRRIEPQSWFLDDTTRNPYAFGRIIAAPSTNAFVLGDPPEGLIYAFSIIPGMTAGCAAVAWGRNAAGRTQAMKIAMAAVMRKHELRRLWAQVAEPNIRGHRLVQKLGFTHEGLLRQALMYNGVWTNVAVYGMLSEELKL